MVRNYKRKTVTTYSEDTLRKCLAAVKAGKISMNKAQKKYGIPYGTIYNKLNGLHKKKHGGQPALSEEFEIILVRALDKLTDWKVPFDGYDIRCLVQSYFNSIDHQSKQFKDNMPGPDWVRLFIKRHNLTKRISDNVKAARAEVTRDIIKSYFSHLEKWVIVPPECIYNFDETNVTDDPGAKTVICRRGRNRVERKVNHSKTSISVMFCGSAAGEFIPPMVVYKSEHCYENWTIGGCNNTVYDCTTNGWFDSRTFQTWFFKQFIPSIRKHQGKQVVLIGDNLGSHFSPKVINACVENNIIFICLPPNTTHLCQPLDVAVFRSAKIEWKDILDTWRRESRRKDNLPKDAFPSMLRKLMQRLKPSNLIAGFKATGICPLNSNEVLKRLPDEAADNTFNESVFNDSVLKVLRENCGVGLEGKRKQSKRGKKVRKTD